MSKVVTDVAPAAPSPATTEVAEPSFESVVASWTPEQRSEWQRTGNEPTQADPSPAKKQMPPASSPGAENEPDLAPGEDEQEIDPHDPSERSRLSREKNARRWEEKIAENARLKTEVEFLRKQGQPPVTSEEPHKVTQAPNGRPKLADFTAKIGETFATYEDAHEAYEDARDDHRFYVEQSRQAKSSWDSQVEALTAKYPDFAGFTGETSFAGIAVIGSHKAGAEIAYWLGLEANKAEARAITARTSIPGVTTDAEFAAFQKKAETDPKAARILAKAEALAEVEFDRIAESFSETPSPKTVLTTRAPAPGPRVRASSTPVDPLDAAYERNDMVAAMKIENERAYASKGKR